MDKNKASIDVIKKTYMLSGVPSDEFSINLGSKINNVAPNKEYPFLTNLVHNK